MQRNNNNSRNNLSSRNPDANVTFGELVSQLESLRFLLDSSFRPEARTEENNNVQIKEKERIARENRRLAHLSHELGNFFNEFDADQFKNKINKIFQSDDSEKKLTNFFNCIVGMSGFSSLAKIYDPQTHRKITEKTLILFAETLKKLALEKALTLKTMLSLHSKINAHERLLTPFTSIKKQLEATLCTAKEKLKYLTFFELEKKTKPIFIDLSNKKNNIENEINKKRTASFDSLMFDDSQATPEISKETLLSLQERQQTPLSLENEKSINDMVFSDITVISDVYNPQKKKEAIDFLESIILISIKEYKNILPDELNRRVSSGIENRFFASLQEIADKIETTQNIIIDLLENKEELSFIPELLVTELLNSINSAREPFNRKFKEFTEETKNVEYQEKMQLSNCASLLKNYETRITEEINKAKNALNEAGEKELNRLHSNEHDCTKNYIKLIQEEIKKLINLLEEISSKVKNLANLSLVQLNKSIAKIKETSTEITTTFNSHYNNWVTNHNQLEAGQIKNVNNEIILFLNKIDSSILSFRDDKAEVSIKIKEKFNSYETELKTAQEIVAADGIDEIFIDSDAGGMQKKIKKGFFDAVSKGFISLRSSTQTLLNEKGEKFTARYKKGELDKLESVLTDHRKANLTLLELYEEKLIEQMKLLINLPKEIAAFEVSLSALIEKVRAHYNNSHIQKNKTFFFNTLNTLFDLQKDLNEQVKLSSVSKNESSEILDDFKKTSLIDNDFQLIHQNSTIELTKENESLTLSGKQLVLRGLSATLDTIKEQLRLTTPSTNWDNLNNSNTPKRSPHPNMLQSPSKSSSSLLYNNSNSPNPQNPSPRTPLSKTASPSFFSSFSSPPKPQQQNSQFASSASGNNNSVSQPITFLSSNSNTRRPDPPLSPYKPPRPGPGNNNNNNQ